jgi:hypothetical protein
MSLAKLFLSGLLVAGGLILGAFTLHGYFDPHWAQKQAQAAGLREAKAINTFQGRSRFVSSRVEPANAHARPQGVVSATGPNPLKAADTRTTPKLPPVKKKVAEKPKKPPQQASVWPWNLFSN